MLTYGLFFLSTGTMIISCPFFDTHQLPCYLETKLVCSSQTETLPACCVISSAPYSHQECRKDDWQVLLSLTLKVTTVGCGYPGIGLMCSLACSG